jgi:hypothetical protein
MAWAAAVTVALIARLGVAAPRAAMAEIRAAACCAAHCPDEPRRPMTPHHCCSVGSSAADPASVTSAAPIVGAPATALALALPPSGPALSCDLHVRGDVPSVRAGPPRYLASLQLRC